MLAHTPAGAGYAVSLEVVDSTAVLQFRDEGPGFTDTRVLERGHSTTGSTGLGLDIVRRTATAAGGTVELVSAPGEGATIEVRLPTSGK